MNLTKFVVDPFTDNARFDWETYRKVVKVFTRMLDNVVEINGLPLAPQRDEIIRKRRHGMGFLGLGSTITMLCMKYGSKKSVAFSQNVSREMAVAGWEAALDLAREKGPAPIMNEEFTVTRAMLRKRPEMVKDGWRVGARISGRVLHARYSRYMQRIAEAAPELVDELAEVGARFTHHTSIAPTCTISLSLANNASNGIEPSFAHHNFRNVIREGKKSKEKVDVFSFELLAYRELVNSRAMPNSQNPAEKLPDYFVSADDIGPKEHVDIQAAAQMWVDSSISKTANVPTDYKYEDFKDIYMYAFDQGLKGCTTFRFNPEAFQGVLVKEDDLKNTTYVFTLEVSARKSKREAIRRSSTTVKCIPPPISSMHSKKAITGSSDHGSHQNRQEDRQVPGTEAGQGRCGGSQGAADFEDNVIWMARSLSALVLIGSTYKIKTPVSDHAVYVTINDISSTKVLRMSSAGHSRCSSTRRISIISNGSWR